jgi:hypothetical protein
MLVNVFGGSEVVYVEWTNMGGCDVDLCGEITMVECDVDQC